MPTAPNHAQFSLVIAYLLATANALIIGLSFSFGKVAVTHVGVVGTNALREKI
ncbi:MAG: hypothetical protein FWC43_08040 [Planctomycetaceae bacterium]|nr:hypothetical protein [Planctomycetaceae bacterium]